MLIFNDLQKNTPYPGVIFITEVIKTRRNSRMPQNIEVASVDVPSMNFAPGRTLCFQQAETHKPSLWQTYQASNGLDDIWTQIFPGSRRAIHRLRASS
jgi:hypothetical protein